MLSLRFSADVQPLPFWDAKVHVLGIVDYVGSRGNYDALFGVSMPVLPVEGIQVVTLPHENLVLLVLDMRQFSFPVDVCNQTRLLTLLLSLSQRVSVWSTSFGMHPFVTVMQRCLTLHKESSYGCESAFKKWCAKLGDDQPIADDLFSSTAVLSFLFFQVLDKQSLRTFSKKLKDALFRVWIPYEERSSA